MEACAAAWYQWMKANHLPTTWKEFLQNLRHRFGASIYGEPQGTLSKLTQTSIVAEFQSAFEDLMNRVTEISETLLISVFITSLKHEIRQELLFPRPPSLMEAFAMASAYEARFHEAKPGPRSWAKWNPTFLPSSPNPLSKLIVSYIFSPTPQPIPPSLIYPPLRFKHLNQIHYHPSYPHAIYHFVVLHQLSFVRSVRRDYVTIVIRNTVNHRCRSRFFTSFGY